MKESRRGQDSMHLWNPCTTAKVEISLPVMRDSFYVHIDSSWFGRVPSSDDYKIFLVYSEYRPYEKSMYLYSLRDSKFTDPEASSMADSVKRLSSLGECVTTSTISYSHLTSSSQ
uniref:Uncharacterized protein n=1 Tax=Chenopodium quinoa TaxID=63459 RepID=A0A803N3A7_CHEQI